MISRPRTRNHCSAAPQLGVMVVIEEKSVSVTNWSKDNDSRMGMTGRGVDQKAFAVEKGEMKLDQVLSLQ
jgi:hypothetical protein